MYTLLVCMALLGTQPDPPDGSLVFLAHNGWIIPKILDATVSHCGIVLRHEGVPHVYEVKPRVTRHPLPEYFGAFLKEPSIRYRRCANICIASPRKPFTVAQVKDMKDWADSQLGRHFSVKGFTTGKPGDGIHCSEFVMTVLLQSDAFHTENAGRVTPETLWTSLGTRYDYWGWFDKSQLRIILNNDSLGNLGNQANNYLHGQEVSRLSVAGCLLPGIGAGLGGGSEEIWSRSSPNSSQNHCGSPSESPDISQDLCRAPTSPCRGSRGTTGCSHSHSSLRASRG